MEFEPVIGIEIHVEMKTKSKMFSSAEVAFGREPNTLIAPLDMAFPGTMPKVNRQAVKYAIRVCHALHMEIDHELWFDRKNYFYSDLPKGFQITQDKRPIGKNGYVTIETSTGKRQIAIERLHMEEDTAKQIHLADFSMLDYTVILHQFLRQRKRSCLLNWYRLTKNLAAHLRSNHLRYCLKE